MPAGAIPCATRSAIMLKEPLRRLPQIPSTLMSLIAVILRWFYRLLDRYRRRPRPAGNAFFRTAALPDDKRNFPSPPASRQILLEPCALGGREAQAQLSTAPEDVVGAARPFLAPKPVDLAGREAGDKGFAEVFGSPRVAQYDGGFTAVAADEPIRNWGVEPGICRAQRGRRGLDGSAGEVSARQRRARGPWPIRAQ